jgi:hypothetical protein
VYPVAWRPFYKYFSLDKAATLCMVTPRKMLGLVRRSKTLYAFKVEGNAEKKTKDKYFIHPDNFLKFVKNRLSVKCRHLAA